MQTNKKRISWCRVCSRHLPAPPPGGIRAASLHRPALAGGAGALRGDAPSAAALRGAGCHSAPPWAEPCGLRLRQSGPPSIGRSAPSRSPRLTEMEPLLLLRARFVSSLWLPGTRLRSHPLPRLWPRAAGGFFVQGPGLLSLLRGPPLDSGPSVGPRPSGGNGPAGHSVLIANPGDWCMKVRRTSATACCPRFGIHSKER